jgi:hypothetical protein
VKEGVLEEKKCLEALLHALEGVAAERFDGTFDEKTDGI